MILITGIVLGVVLACTICAVVAVCELDKSQKDIEETIRRGRRE